MTAEKARGAGASRRRFGRSGVLGRSRRRSRPLRHWWYRVCAQAVPE
jgi:hypothetical protein